MEFLIFTYAAIQFLGHITTAYAVVSAPTFWEMNVDSRKTKYIKGWLKRNSVAVFSQNKENYIRNFFIKDTVRP